MNSQWRNQGSRIEGTGLSRRTALRVGLAAVPVAASLMMIPASSMAATSQSPSRTAAVPTVAELLARRRQLVPGAYRPDSATTGPVAGTVFRSIDGNLSVSSDGQVIENVDITGCILLNKFSNVVVRNCIIRGAPSDSRGPSGISSSDGDLRGLRVEDSRLQGRSNAWSSGIRGGNYTMRRTSITYFVDGVALVSPLGNVTIEGCWIHNGVYAEWQDGDPDYPASVGSYTHSDGIQFHCGKNYVIRGNMIGGTRVVGSPQTGAETAIRSGDDYYNSALMIKQEFDDSDYRRIENVLIEKNWLAGGCCTVNLVSGRSNNFATTVIRNNRFIRSTWGAQYYVLRGAGLGQFSNNVFDDNSAQVPISRGA